MPNETDNQQPPELNNLIANISTTDEISRSDLNSSVSLKNQQNIAKRDSLIIECYDIYKLCMEDNRSHRKIFSIWSICLLTIIFVIMGVIGVYVGIHKADSEAIVITLLCTNTANLIGLVAIIFRYLFSSHDKDFLSAHASLIKQNIS